MPRVASHARLPPLASACPALAEPAIHGQSFERIAAGLRAALAGLQQDRESPFYPVREVARLAGVSYATAQRAYRQLAAEGWLRVVRGSQTLLRGRRHEPRRRVRGCVVVPVWMPGFLQLPTWRRFYISLESELRQHDLVADFLFYEGRRDGEPDFADRVLGHHPDQLFWFLPSLTDMPQIRRIADMGIRVTALLNAPSSDFPGRWNVMTRQRAQQRAFRCWRHEGIESALFIFDPLLLPQVLQRLGVVAEKAGLRWSCYPPRAEGLLAYVRGLQHRRIPPATGVMLHDFLFALLCERAPELMARLLRRHRVLIEEPIDLPPDLLAGVRVDYLAVDWPRVARVLARQMAEEATPAQSQPVIFHARWQPHVLAQELTERLRRE